MLDRVIKEITLCYQPPNGVKSSDDARMWAAAFSQAIADETSDACEFAEAWREFRRQHTRGFWPTPGAVCEAIRNLRIARREFSPTEPPRERLPEPNYHEPERVTWATRMRTLEAIEQARAMNSPLGNMLVKLGESIIERNGGVEG
ncbi:MAG TPA: hypothetical protein VF151_08480 [Gemmatimonadales bacterium]